MVLSIVQYRANGVCNMCRSMWLPVFDAEVIVSGRITLKYTEVVNSLWILHVLSIPAQVSPNTRNMFHD